MFRNDAFGETIKRAFSGPYIEEQEYDLAMAARIGELVKEYDIRFDPERPVPSDGEMADRVFQAGVKLFHEIGVYHMDTSRVIKYGMDEIEEGLRQAPASFIAGEGNDAVWVRHRNIEETEPPLNLSGPAGLPMSEATYSQLLFSIARESYVDAIESGAVATYLGEDIMAGTPTEVLAVQRTVAQAREAVRLAGRPGMHIGDAATGITAMGKMAASNPEHGLRPTDARIVSEMCELKTDHDQLARVPHLKDYGSLIIHLMTPLTGGVGGGPEGVALMSVAELLLGAITYQADYHYVSITHIIRCNNTDRWGLWVQAMIGQAIARNTHLVATNDPFVVSGPCTAEILYEVAAASAVGTVCGFTMHGVGATGGFLENHSSGLELAWQGEIAHAVTKSRWTRDEVNEFCLKMLEKYEHTFDDPNRGKPFEGCYDLLTVEPTTEWSDIYHRVRDELFDLGLEFTGKREHWPQRTAPTEEPAVSPG